MFWYEEKRSGLGEEFVSEVDATLDAVAERPEIFQQVPGAPGVRRALLHRFPYAIVFVFDSDRVTVLAVAHGKRRPLYWKARQPRV